MSWGNRPGGAHAVSADVVAQDRRFRSFRSTLVFAWLGTNWVLSQALDKLGRDDTRLYKGLSVRGLRHGSAGLPIGVPSSNPSSRARTACVQAVQWYGTAVVFLGGATLVMRVLGCFAYVAIQAWKFSPAVPPTWRRCHCCRAATGFQEGQRGRSSAASLGVSGAPLRDHVEIDAGLHAAAPRLQAPPGKRASKFVPAVVSLPDTAAAGDAAAAAAQTLETSAGGAGAGAVAGVGSATGKAALLSEAADRMSFRSFRINPVAAKLQQLQSGGAAVSGGSGGGAAPQPVLAPRRALVGDDGLPGQDAASVTVSVNPIAGVTAL